MRVTILSLLSCIIFAISAFAHDEVVPRKHKTIQIPFTMDRNLTIVSAELNGQPAQKFVFDTGTEGLTLSEAIATQLGLKGEGYTDVGRPNDPNPARARNIVLSSLAMKGFVAKDLAGVALAEADLFLPPGVVGILGLRLFQGYLVTIDYAKGLLILQQGVLSADASSVLPVNLIHIVETTIKVNGKEMPTHIDSGGPESIVFPLEWKDQLNLKSEPVLYAHARTGSGEIDMYKSQLIGKIEIGGIVLHDPEITLASGGFIGINIGYPFLRKYAVTFDMANGLVRFTSNEKAPKE
jgi:predicted aspartyl protease